MKTLMFAVAFGATILSTPAPAQTAPSGAGRQVLTRAEVQQFAGALFDSLDLNHDGLITRDEAEQARAKLASGDEDGRKAERAKRMIDRIFDTSQSVTRSQFEAMSLARFDRQDANRDGVVTRDERSQTREQNAPGQ